MEKTLAKKKLRNQISLIMIILIIVVVAFIGVAVSFTFINQTKAQINELVSTNGQTSVVSMNEYIKSLEKEISSIAASGSITSSKLTQEDRQKNIKAIFDVREDLSSLYTLDSSYTAVNDAASEDIGENYKEEYWATEGMNSDGFFIDAPGYDEWTDNITMTVTYRVKKDGFDGIICMDVHYDVIDDMINRDQFGEDGYSMIVAADGRLVAYPDTKAVSEGKNYKDVLEGKDEFKNAIEKSIAGNMGLIKDVDYNGEKQLFYYDTIDSTNWTLVSVLKNSHYNQTLYRELITIIIIGVISIIVAGIVSLILSKRIAGPIGVMSKRMKLFADGDLHTPMPDIKSNNEIGVLYDSLKDSIDSLSSYVSDISGTLGSMADGDINIAVNMEYVGDFAPIKKSLNEILDSLNNVLGVIVRSAKEVDLMSEQMAASAEELSSNTIEKAATTDELDVTFKNIKDSLNATAENTANALERASTVQSQISLSSDEINAMRQSMADISESADSIGNIIKSIDDIAFQTNILSLNAAVEAARAGESGKGFGVVADEVRELANKSAESAKESESLINNSLRAVERGESTAENSWVQINQAQALVEEVANLIKEIQETSAKQALGATDIYQGISQLNGIIQNDSAMSEQNASQSQELSMVASELEHRLSFFTLREEGTNVDKLIPEVANQTDEINIEPSIETNVESDLNLPESVSSDAFEYEPNESNSDETDPDLGMFDELESLEDENIPANEPVSFANPLDPVYNAGTFSTSSESTSMDSGERDPQDKY